MRPASRATAAVMGGLTFNGIPVRESAKAQDDAKVATELGLLPSAKCNKPGGI